jgi:hypothetical protein
VLSESAALAHADQDRRPAIARWSPRRDGSTAAQADADAIGADLAKTKDAASGRHADEAGFPVPASFAELLAMRPFMWRVMHMPRVRR